MLQGNDDDALRIGMFILFLIISYTMDGPCKVFLGGIPPSVDEGTIPSSLPRNGGRGCVYSDKLAHHLSRYGRVAEVRIYRDMETGRHKGFGFAIMGDPSQAKAACHGGNNNYIDSKWVSAMLYYLITIICTPLVDPGEALL